MSMQEYYDMFDDLDQGEIWKMPENIRKWRFVL